MNPVAGGVVDDADGAATAGGLVGCDCFRLLEDGILVYENADSA